MASMIKSCIGNTCKNCMKKSGEYCSKLPQFYYDWINKLTTETAQEFARRDVIDNRKRMVKFEDEARILDAEQEKIYDLLNGEEMSTQNLNNLINNMELVNLIKNAFTLYYTHTGLLLREQQSNVTYTRDDIQNLDPSRIKMYMVELMCSDKAPDYLLTTVDDDELERAIDACTDKPASLEEINRGASQKFEVPGLGQPKYDPDTGITTYSMLDDGLRQRPTRPTTTMERGGKRKIRKTASKRKKTVHRATKRRVHTRKHGNKKNKRHVKKHTKRA